MNLKWTDSLDLALALIDKYPEQEPEQIRFTDLREWIMQLEEFDDDPMQNLMKKLESMELNQAKLISNHA